MQQMYEKGEHPNPPFWSDRQKFIPLGIRSDKTTKGYDILIHPRSVEKENDQNWSVREWLVFLSKFRNLKMGCIGTRENY